MPPLWGLSCALFPLFAVAMLTKLCLASPLSTLHIVQYEFDFSSDLYRVRHSRSLTTPRVVLSFFFAAAA